MTTSDEMRYRCLIIEDNVPAAELMKIYLNRFDIASAIATNGAIGLQMFLDEPLKYHIIFLDIQMPVMGGYEVAKRIREGGTENASTIPIIAMSGTTTGDVLANNHFSLFLRKPFEFHSLDSVLCHFLKMDGQQPR